MPADYPGQPGCFQPRNLMEFPRAENTVDLVGSVLIWILALLGLCCPSYSLSLVPTTITTVPSGSSRAVVPTACPPNWIAHSRVNTKLVWPITSSGLCEKTIIPCVLVSGMPPSSSPGFSTRRDTGHSPSCNARYMSSENLCTSVSSGLYQISTVRLGLPFSPSANFAKFRTRSPALLANDVRDWLRANCASAASFWALAVLCRSCSDSLASIALRAA